MISENQIVNGIGIKLRRKKKTEEKCHWSALTWAIEERTSSTRSLYPSSIKNIILRERTHKQMDIATYRLSVCHTLFSITKLVIPWFRPCVSCFESYTHMHMNVVSSFQCVYLPPTSVCSASSKKAFASEANTREHKRTVIRKHFSAVFKCSRQFNSEKKITGINCFLLFIC